MESRAKRLLFAIGGAAALALSLLAGAVNAAPAGSVGLSHLVLTTSDLPRGFVQIYAKGENASQALSNMGMSGGQLRKDGFSGAYANAFELGCLASHSCSSPRGLVAAVSGVLAFTKASGAHSVIAALKSSIPSSLHRYSPMSLGRLGNEGFGVTSSSQTMDGVSVTEDLVFFRQGKYVGLILGGGRSMTLGREDSAVSHLATTLDGHIKSNG